jgi:hypothetical protein
MGRWQKGTDRARQLPPDRAIIASGSVAVLTVNVIVVPAFAWPRDRRTSRARCRSRCFTDPTTPTIVAVGFGRTGDLPANRVRRLENLRAVGSSIIATVVLAAVWLR